MLPNKNIFALNRCNIDKFQKNTLERKFFSQAQMLYLKISEKKLQIAKNCSNLPQHCHSLVSSRGKHLKMADSPEVKWQTRTGSSHSLAMAFGSRVGEGLQVKRTRMLVGNFQCDPQKYKVKQR